MKKFTGRYTTNTAKALKGSERILCKNARFRWLRDHVPGRRS